MTLTNIKQNLQSLCFPPSLQVFLLYGVLAIALLSPMASASVIPYIPDLPPNIGHVIQARMALEEGQFPIQIAPWQHNGWGYPVFQFYGQFLYTFLGLVYQLITPANPYLACLLGLWLALCGGAWFIYQTSFLLIRNRVAAILAGTAYMMAPYWLVNIHARGALAEAVAQGVLPMVIYFVVCSFLTPKLCFLLLASLAWFLLATTHLITFVYSSLFIGLFVICLALLRPRSWMRALGIAVSYGLSWLLACSYLAPIGLTQNLIIHDSIGQPYYSNWLTPLPTLLQPVSLPPEPQPGHPTTPNLHAAVGWVLLMAAFVVAYYCMVRPSWLKQPHANGYFVAPLLGLFALSFFVTWSPVDFWQFLPQQLWLTQFTYRLLGQVIWIGALLCGFALPLLFRNRLDARHLVIGILLMGLACSSYLPSLNSTLLTLTDFLHKPDLGYGSFAYLYKQTQPLPLSGISSLVAGDGWLNLDQEGEFFLNEDTIPILHMQGEIPSDWFKNALTLSVWVNGQRIAQTELQPGSFSWDAPLKISLEDRANSKPFQVKFTTSRAISTIGYWLQERHLSIQIRSLHIQGLSPANTVLPVADTSSALQRQGTRIKGTVRVPEDAQIVQIPLLFYSKLLTVKADGKRVDYFPTPAFDHLPEKIWNTLSSQKPEIFPPGTSTDVILKRRRLQSSTEITGYYLASVWLPPGVHKLRAEFTGLWWANWVSALACIGIGLVAGFQLLQKLMQGGVLSTFKFKLFSHFKFNK